MLRSIWSLSSLLGGMGILLTGSGLLGIVLSLRGMAAGFDPLTLGLVMSGFYVGYMAGSWVWPGIIQRVGHIRAFACFAASAAALALTYGLVVDPLVWWCLRVLNGMMIMGIYMVIESWLSERARDGRARIFSVYMMINLTAVAVGQYLIAVWGAQELASFALAAILFCLGLLPIALTPLRQPVPIRTPRLSLRRLLRISPVGVTASFGAGLALGAFWAMAPVYATALGLVGVGVAHFTAAAIVGGALLQWPIGWLSDRYDRRKVLVAITIATSVALAGLGTVDLIATQWFGAPRLRAEWVVPLSFAFGAFLFSIYGIAVAQTHDRFPSSEALEATRGLLLVHGVGAAIGPFACGAIMQWLPGRGFPVFLGAVTVALTFFTLWRIRRDPPVPPEERGSFRPMEQESTVIFPDDDSADESVTGEASTDSAHVGAAAWRRPSGAPPSRRATDTIDDTPQAGLVKDATPGTAGSRAQTGP